MLPDFVIIGAMKGGTSSLYRYLAPHPDLVPCSIKETDFFKSTNDFSKGLGWYTNLFTQGGGRHAFEASPNYTKRHIFPGVAERMHSMIPGAKLIYVLRDPIERVLSHYVHNYADGRESRSFSQVISDPESSYVQTSKYHYQLQAFLEYYPYEQLHLVQSERLREDPVTMIRDICEFLRVPFAYDPAVVTKRFHESIGKTRQSELESRFLQATRNRYLRGAIRRAIRPLRTSVSKPVLSASDRDFLCNAIGPDTEKLRGFSGCEFRAGPSERSAHRRTSNPPQVTATQWATKRAVGDGVGRRRAGSTMGESLQQAAEHRLGTIPGGRLGLRRSS